MKKVFEVLYFIKKDGKYIDNTLIVAGKDKEEVATMIKEISDKIGISQIKEI